MFNLTLDVPPNLAGRGERLDVDCGDFQSLVMDACELLGEAGCRFRMGGFGKDDWNLNVSYDMSTVIEQLPDVLAALDRGAQAEIDLYSQGIERTITVTPDGDYIHLWCQSRTSWTPNPEMERMDRGYVIEAFRKLATDFAKALISVQPELADVEPLARWQAGEV